MCELRACARVVPTRTFVTYNAIMRSKLLVVLGIVGSAGLGFWYVFWGGTQPTDPSAPALPDDVAQAPYAENESTNPVPEPTDYRELPVREAVLSPVVTGLDAPWAFTWLPSGELLVTERFGTLQLIRTDGQAVPVRGIPDVFTGGQGGLLDVTIHPEFATNSFVYISYSAGTEEANRLTIARATLVGTQLENIEEIFSVAQAKSGGQHFGSRFAWLPDGTILFSVGDGGNPPLTYNGAYIREQAQNRTTHFGSIIRINDDGSIPDDNPYIGRPDVLPEIYSFGHRNVQGIAVDALRERVVASEHGSKGGDELNEILPGQNYGWPRATFSTEYDVFSTAISDAKTLPTVRNPLAVWTPTIAPSSVVAYTGDAYEAANVGDLFLAAMLLRSNTTIAAYASSPAGAVLRLSLTEAGAVRAQERIVVGEQRVRSIAQGPDGYLYVLVDATGRQSRPGRNAGAIYQIDRW